MGGCGEFLLKGGFHGNPGTSLDPPLGTGAFWELAVIIYVRHLQNCFESGGTVEKRQVLVCHTKSMELSQHF